MEAPLSLTLLYTANIAGDLAQLPRLFTFLQRLKSDPRQPSLLLDLGGSCADNIWHCRETGGRSTLIALDGMGYHAANVADFLDPDSREKLAAQVTLGLVDTGRDWLHQPPLHHDFGIRVTLRPSRQAAGLLVCLARSETTRIEGKTLYLAEVGTGQVGEAAVKLRGMPALVSARLHEMPPDTPPNPSIAGLVDFVEAEARLLAKQRIALRNSD